MRSLLLEDRDYVHKRPQKEGLSLSQQKYDIEGRGPALPPRPQPRFSSCKSGWIMIN